MADPIEKSSIELRLNPGHNFSLSLDNESLERCNHNYLEKISLWFKDMEEFLAQDPVVLNGSGELVSILRFVRYEVEMLKAGERIDVREFQKYVDYLRSLIYTPRNQQPQPVLELDSRFTFDGTQEEIEEPDTVGGYYVINHHFEGSEDKVWEMINYYLPNLINNLHHIEG